MSSTKLTDGATFCSFSEFVSKLKVNHATLLLRVLREKTNEITKIIYYLLVGLYNSSLSVNSIQIMRDFSDEGKYLSECLRVFIGSDSFDYDIVKKLLNSAINNKNLVAISYTIAITLRVNNKSATDDLFISGIEELTKYQDTSWVNISYFCKNIDKFFKEADDKVIDIVLANLRYAKKLTCEIEYILNAIYNKSVEKFVNYFQSRIEQARLLETQKDYEAIPYELYVLRGNINAKMAVFNLIFTLSDSFGQLAPKLINLFYSKYTDDINTALMGYLDENFRDNLELVLSILAIYKGDVKMYPLCEFIIKALDSGDEFLADIQSIMLGEKGIISGTGVYGLAEHYQARKPYFVIMSESADERLKAFSMSALRDIDNSIAIHRRRGDHDEMNFLDKH